MTKVDLKYRIRTHNGALAIHDLEFIYVGAHPPVHNRYKLSAMGMQLSP